MTIIFKFPKYDYLQYDNNFKKIVIFKIQNMTKKKPMSGGRVGAGKREKEKKEKTKKAISTQAR